MDEAAGDDLRSGDDLPGLAIDRDDDHQDAVLGKRPAVADHHLADRADREAIDVDVARLDPLSHGDLLGRDLDHVADLGEGDVLSRDAVLQRQIGIERHVPVLAVERHHELRRDRSSMSASSSRLAWPETWTRARA